MEQNYNISLAEYPFKRVRYSGISLYRVDHSKQRARFIPTRARRNHFSNYAHGGKLAWLACSQKMESRREKNLVEVFFLDAFSHLYKRVCPSVRPSVGRSVRRSVRRLVRHTRVEFLGNGLNLNKMASRTCYYAI